MVVHAAGESATLGASPGPGTCSVVLAARDEAELCALSKALADAGYAHRLIEEDWGRYAGQVMALGLAPVQRDAQLKGLLGSLRLLR